MRALFRVPGNWEKVEGIDLWAELKDEKRSYYFLNICLHEISFPPF
jgi:hypothetical protein